MLFTVVTDPQRTLDLGEATGRVHGSTVPGLARTELYAVFTLTGDSVELDVEYSTDLFEEKTIARWSEEMTHAFGARGFEIGPQAFENRA